MKRTSRVVVLILVSSFTLSACGGTPTPDIEATVQAAVVATQAAQPTNTPVLPTDTPKPPTRTLTPTNTPKPPTPTNTLVPPTHTPTPTDTPEPPTDTPTPVPPTPTFTPTPTMMPTIAPTPDSAPLFAGVWHRLHAERSIGNHQVIDCQEGKMWTCTFSNQPEPDLGFRYSPIVGVFEGKSIPDWDCPNWFPEAICKNAIFVIGGRTLFKEGEGPGLQVDIEYIVIETGGGQILYEYWVNRFACPWYRSFDDALARNPYPHDLRDCLQAP